MAWVTWKSVSLFGSVSSAAFLSLFQCFLQSQGSEKRDESIKGIPPKWVQELAKILVFSTED